MEEWQELVQNVLVTTSSFPTTQKEGSGGVEQNNCLTYHQVKSYLPKMRFPA